MLLRAARSCSSCYRRRLKIAHLSVSCVDATERESSINIPWQRFLLEVTYNGSKYHGAIASGEYRSVKSAIQDACGKLVGTTNVKFLSVSSRTDKGVHAYHNTFHVDLLRRKRNVGEIVKMHNEATVQKALNAILRKNQEQVSILKATAVPQSFSARGCAYRRTYMYNILAQSTPVLTMFHSDRAWCVSDALDLSSMEEAVSLLEGTHDFTAFRSAGCEANSPVRTIHRATVGAETLPRGLGADSSHELITITFQGRSFLYNQVRNMVSAIVDIGRGRMSPHDIAKLLQCADNNYIKNKAPAQGLSLARVDFASSYEEAVAKAEANTRDTDNKTRNEKGSGETSL